MATDLLSRIATEDDEEYTLHPANRYRDTGNGKYTTIDDDNDEDYKPSKKKPKRSNGYTTVDMAGDDEMVSQSKNPFDEINDTFDNKDDPEQYVEVYKHIKNNIRLIEKNTVDIPKLRDKVYMTISQEEYQKAMQELDRVMIQNSQLIRKIKQRLKEEKNKNDKLASAEDQRSSSILQWRVNQLNSCVRQFKKCAVEFETELKSIKNACKDNEKRKLRMFTNKDELTEVEMEEMVDHPAQLETFLMKKYELMETSDALLERIHELEDRHQGLLKIEKSIHELHELWMELNVMVTEQQENLDHIEANVEETKHYLEKAGDNLVSAEKKQKCSRKMGCCVVCFLLIIVILIVVFLGGFLKFN